MKLHAIFPTNHNKIVVVGSGIYSTSGVEYQNFYTEEPNTETAEHFAERVATKGRPTKIFKMVSAFGKTVE